jgi:hypothetical protein
MLAAYEKFRMEFEILFGHYGDPANCGVRLSPNADPAAAGRINQRPPMKCSAPVRGEEPAAATTLPAGDDKDAGEFGIGLDE